MTDLNKAIELAEKATEQLQKSHVKEYTRSNGTVVKEHDDSRHAASDHTKASKKLAADARGETKNTEMQANVSPHPNQAYVDSKIKKIDALIKDYAKGIGTSWETGAVKRFVASELQGITAGKKVEEWAAAKIAAGKASTFDQLKLAIGKLVKH